MPELPEAERARRLIESIAEGRRIERVWCDADDIVFDGVTPRTMQRSLNGKTVVAAARHGKQLWMELDAGPHPLFHLGMTGEFLSPASERIRYASSGKKDLETAWPPRFAKIRFEFNDGGELAMTNKRRLGRIRLREDPRNEPPIADLGFDPYLSMPTPKQFVELLGRRRGNIKGLLLDQSFAAGVGNWIADEVLYQAAIDPRRTADSLDGSEAKRVRSKLSHVVRVAVKANANKAKLPKSWLFHHRWGASDGPDALPDGRAIRRASIGGRTTAWVPEVQG